MLQMVDEGVSILTGERDLVEFSVMLHEAWMLKRRLTSRITTRPSMRFMRQQGRRGPSAENFWAPAAAASCCFSQDRRIMSGFVWLFPDCFRCRLGF